MEKHQRNWLEEHIQRHGLCRKTRTRHFPADEERDGQSTSFRSTMLRREGLKVGIFHPPTDWHTENNPNKMQNTLHSGTNATSSAPPYHINPVPTNEDRRAVIMTEANTRPYTLQVQFCVRTQNTVREHVRSVEATLSNNQINFVRAVSAESGVRTLSPSRSPSRSPSLSPSRSPSPWRGAASAGPASIVKRKREASTKELKRMLSVSLLSEVLVGWRSSSYDVQYLYVSMSAAALCRRHGAELGVRARLPVLATMMLRDELGVERDIRDGTVTLLQNTMV
ncbi:hypothetical protein FA95DRAFT_336926 [Auriscalpium vulgare]|uniref:Uncharacterized protein n=1 Tax=Auriscalpium vulgare TaxID=40419 RepID=A0ACB8RIQ8_9AGAM|nr:hypothetical protein FA95DRAFT_336926 [Auriscalpium vulgare]